MYILSVRKNESKVLDTIYINNNHISSTGTKTVSMGNIYSYFYITFWQYVLTFDFTFYDLILI